MAKKNLKKLANKLFLLSLENECISQERVEAVLTALREYSPRNHKFLLEKYCLKIAAQLKKERASVQYAGSVQQDLLNSVQSKLEKYYKRSLMLHAQENPYLIAGFLIRIADDVWDISVLGRLRTFSDSMQ